MGIKKKLTLQEQWNDLLNVAHRRGMKVRKGGKTLKQSLYRAMNPQAATLLGVPCPAKTILYCKSARRSAHRRVMDVRHELLEDDKIKQLRRRGVPRNKLYPMGHRFANKHQLDTGAIE